MLLFLVNEEEIQMPQQIQQRTHNAVITCSCSKGIDGGGGSYNDVGLLFKCRLGSPVFVVI